MISLLCHLWSKAMDGLTTYEKVIVRQLLEGKSAAQIAARLGLSRDEAFSQIDIILRRLVAVAPNRDL